MATKLQLITELSERTANTIIKSPANWTSFLKTVGWNYKYPFHDQLLIYAQRPDATACAPIELWNERFGRWVNRGAKGIALIDDSGSHLSLRHVFDVSDTNSRYDRPVVLWTLKDGYSEYVIETLENAFGDLKDKSNMPYAIISAAINAAQDNYSDYLSDLLYSRENSFLEELDELNVDVIFKNALSNSVAYVLLVRCGYPANEFFSFEDFQDIVNFNTLDTISRLGAATSDISEMILKEIGATVKELQKSERNQNRTFAKSQDVRHNKSVNNRDERADGHGIDIHDAKRLSDTGSDAAGGRNAHREIWDVAKNIPEKPQERNIRQPDVVGATEQSSDRDRPDGEGTNRDNGSEVTHGESGTGQSDRPDSMDGTYEQSKAFSRGNNTGGTGLQLTLFPTVEQQIEAIEQAEDNKTSAFSISQEEIDHALCKGSGVQDGKFRIYLHYQEQHSTKETINFLKQEYGTGGGTHFFLDGTHGNEWHDGKGISLSKNGSFITNPDIKLTWSQVAKRLGELISVDRYLNSKEKEHLPIVRQEMEGRRQKLAEEAYARTILDREPESVEPNQLPSRDTVNYSLHLGDTVYLGADEYEVVSFDSNVVELRDMNCPILTKQFQRETFERMMRENPLNDHLIEQGGIPEQPAEEETQTPSPRMLYQTYLSEIVSKVRADEIYPMLRDRDTDPDSAKREIDIAIDRIVLSMQREQPAFYEAYTNLPHFKEWFTEDVFQRTYQDYLTEKKDSVIIHSNDPDAPEWLQELRDVNKTHEPDIIQQSKNDEDNTQNSEVTNVTVDLESEKIKQERINYHITNDELGHGGQKTKYGWNITAIRLLNLLETENRLATSEEQEILSRYVGWGGMPQVFDEQNSQWAKEYNELKELLDEDEYASARASTLNAHFTSPVVIKAMYTCLANMGFETGNILEPSCGVGNFLGLIPDSMKDSKLYGIELDSITGRIAKQLYQKANIAVQGFEETNLPDSFFDLAVGNVPFGSYGVADKKYDKYKFLIHDYFFAKTLDKVRPGGIIAFITSKGTMDKQNPEVRKYIAQRAELLGAVRLPNNAFLANAGTEVTADILFLQKRDRVIDIVPDWVNLSTTEDGIPVNSYFADNTDMILGTMGYSERMYGNAKETTCTPYENADLAELLREALENIHAEITEYEMDDISDDIDTSIPADPNVRNFSYTVVDGEVYYRENSRMNKVEVSVTAEGRIKGMIAIRDCVRDLIEYQTEDYSDEVIQEQQQKLNRLYDTFTSKYGLLNSRGNNMAFSDDSSYCLLCSLEILDENGELERKADMFTKRTIRQRTIISHVDTATEALAISIAEKACVDIGFMKGLTGLSEEQLINDLEGVVFRNPEKLDNEGTPIFETGDAYLSGNVREKLKTALQFAQMHPDIYNINVTALERVQLKDLSASEIDVRLGATWLPPDVVKDFIFELLETPYMYKRYIDVFYSSYTANWNVKGKNDDRSGNIKAVMTYGTNRINAYKIIEETLNLKDVRIFDTVYEDGVEKRVLNKKETAIAQQKQETIKEAFQSWIWKDPTRRERLTRIYNDRFNSIRPREYDGSHIRFTGMNPEISLRKHQVDAVAHILYGGNTLLAHCVGAGKTYEMTAAAMESKHLGLCQKSLFVVPNHLTEQWAAEFLQLYPSANILVATKKDFETKNRKKFCARIATGDYDAVIIGHSQFEKIPISQERQKRQLEEQIAEITSGIQELKEERGERYAIKQLEKTKKTLKSRLDKLNDTSRKDDVVTFEELGVDRLFVDEADFYKNLFLYTKMRNVAGLSQTEAQKSSDLFAKCRYLDELTEGRGIIFATGTPISNSITEMYTMQRYLQYEALRKNGLQHFDCWASTFGETVTAIELAPEGTGYRAKTRFARFYNLPELMNMFKEVADIKTADMLNLPVPKANYHNVSVKPSQFQQDMVAELAERAERVRNKEVEPYEDNMLKITNDGRKLALEQRLTNPMLPDYEDSKVNACVENIFRFWQENNDRQLTQLVFCDLSTPKNDGNFNVYDDVRQKLIERGVPADEVAFIHDANTETRKKELFAKVRKGQVRVLLGSTFKMGAGTNVQDRLIALHDLDCPWRPRDLEQRSGRIIRQGNKNDEVYIFRYVTENTFDAYLYQILENKQRFISQIMTSKSPVRSAEDIDETALSYAEVKALATGNLYIKEKMDLDIQVSKLKLLKANHLSQRYALEDRLLKHYPQQIKSTEERIAGYEKDLILYEKHNALEPVAEGAEDSKFAGMTVKGVHYTEKAKAGAAILEACKLMTSPEPQELGCYMEFPMMFSFDGFNKQYQITLRGAMSHTVTLGTDTHGNITRLNNVLAEIPKKLEYCREQLKTLHQQIETAKQEVNIPFEKDEELQTKSARLSELNILLNMDKHDNEMLDGEPDENVDVPEKKTVGYER